MNIHKPGGPSRPNTGRVDRRDGQKTAIRGTDGTRRVTDVSAQDPSERDESSYQRERATYEPRAIGPHEKTPLPGGRLGGALPSPHAQGAQLRRPSMSAPRMPADAGSLHQLAARLHQSFAQAPAERQAAAFSQVLTPGVAQGLLDSVQKRLQKGG